MSLSGARRRIVLAQQPEVNSAGAVGLGGWSVFGQVGQRDVKLGQRPGDRGDICVGVTRTGNVGEPQLVLVHGVCGREPVSVRHYEVVPDGGYFAENWCRGAGAKLIALFGGHGGGGGRLLRRGLLKFFVGALKVFDVPVFELPDARGHFVQDVFVVSHQ